MFLTLKILFLFSLSAAQLCSWWTTTTRCICGRAGGLRTVKAPAQPESAGTQTGSVPWRPCCSTVEVDTHLCHWVMEQSVTLHQCVFKTSDLLLSCSHRKEREEASQSVSDPCRTGASHLHQHVPQLGAQRGHCWDHWEGVWIKSHYLITPNYIIWYEPVFSQCL